MLYNAKNSTVKTADFTMDYVSFGNGKKTLVILPGLGDGLRTVKGTALPMAFMYRTFADDYTVYIFSRRNNIRHGCTTADMAKDLKDAMDALGIKSACVTGVSMGGMIAQHLAADYPQYVEKLVLAATCSKPNPVLESSVNCWVELAAAGSHTKFMDSNLKLIYSPQYYRRNRWLVPIAGLLTKPRSYNRFFIQADACLTHNAYNKLKNISCPVLVIGGEKDMALGGDASREIAAEITHSQLKMYNQWGHGLYEEARDFCNVIKTFLKTDN